MSGMVGTVGTHPDRQIAELRRGVLEYCVMALLQGEERYGFDLVRELATWEGMKTGEGTLYPLLGRLRRDGLLESRWHESPSGPPRRYYRLTEQGRDALARFRLEWARFAGAVGDMLGRKP